LSDKIRVVIADDNNAVREALEVLFDVFSDLELVGQAENGQEAVRLCAELQPDAVLMDLVMPVMDGITATRIIHDQFPHIKVVALTTAIDDGLLKAVIGAGAVTYLFKYTTIDAIAETIRNFVY
jgi:two-component system, NarL family, response regulator LiaR